MACCAFALLVLGSIISALMAIRRALGFADDRDAGAPRNPATAWQLHPASGAVLAPGPDRRRVAPTKLLGALLGIALVATGAAWLSAPQASRSDVSWSDTFWCRSASSPVELAEARDR